MTLGNFTKSIQDIMRKDSGVNGDAQRIEQIVWMLFLKIIDSKEEEWVLLEGSEYKEIIPSKYQWRNWASNDEGITGDELLEFVESMFKDLRAIELSEGVDKRKRLVKNFFSDTHNYMKSGTLLRQVINIINKLNFHNYEERHAFNDIYENILRDLQSAGNAGEFYTPRPVTDFIIDILAPKHGEKIADFACGTGGFLVSAFEYIKKHDGQNLSAENLSELGVLLYGVEKKPLPHSLCLTNMLLHGLETPNIEHGNGLSLSVQNISPLEKVDVIAMNPPFGGSEEEGIKTNFPYDMRTSETADLFLIRILYQLKEYGRAGIVLPDGFLFGDGVKITIKKKMLEECNLHTIVRLPSGVFAPYTSINTNILFFEKGKPTKEIWYYEIPLPQGYRSFSKTKVFTRNYFKDVELWWKDRNNGDENSYLVSIEEIKERVYNLDIKNPNKIEEIQEYSVEELLTIMTSQSTAISTLITQLSKNLEGIGR